MYLCCNLYLTTRGSVNIYGLDDDNITIVLQLLWKIMSKTVLKTADLQMVFTIIIYL